jgi:hypothetical protein
MKFFIIGMVIELLIRRKKRKSLVATALLKQAKHFSGARASSLQGSQTT